jgi:hypothetical protein
MFRKPFQMRFCHRDHAVAVAQDRAVLVADVSATQRTRRQFQVQPGQEGVLFRTHAHRRGDLRHDLRIRQSRLQPRRQERDHRMEIERHADKPDEDQVWLQILRKPQHLSLGRPVPMLDLGMHAAAFDALAVRLRAGQHIDRIAAVRQPLAEAGDMIPLGDRHGRKDARDDQYSRIFGLHRTPPPNFCPTRLAACRTQVCIPTPRMACSKASQRDLDCPRPARA